MRGSCEKKLFIMSFCSNQAIDCLLNLIQTLHLKNQTLRTDFLSLNMAKEASTTMDAMDGLKRKIGTQENFGYPLIDVD